MPNALLTGVSGLISHQRLLDVVGHNIANLNTTGFKAQRILFADLLYETIRPAASSNDGDQGGVNPNQIGGGVKVAATDRKFSQGALESTGEALDFAISGNGFFTVSDGTNDFYTRAGAFSLDEEGFLVAPGGLHVQRFSSVGEPDGVNPGFQVQGDSKIRIPLGAPVEGVVSTEVQVTGNLSGEDQPATQQLLTSLAPFQTGGAPATGATLLNSVDSNATPYVAGDQIFIDGTFHDGTELTTAALPVDGTTTLQDLVAAIDAAFPDAQASLTPDGRITLLSNTEGGSNLELRLSDAPGNTGQIPFADHKFDVTTPGENAGTAETVVTIFDSQGGAHEVKIVFEKQTDDIWEMTASIDPSEGTVVDDTISNILFSDDGSLINTGDATITLQINGIAQLQPITFSFSDDTSVRLTHFNSDSTLVPVSDGAAPGVLAGVRVERDGLVRGIASNGKIFDIAQLAITGFRNAKGLIAEADNLYSESLNSGQPEIGTAGTGGRGEIGGGQIEASNVDIAFEFTRLIVAQRGFSANARTITVADEILEELTNIIR